MLCPTEAFHSIFANSTFLMRMLNTNEQLITRLLQQALTIHQITDGLGKLGFHNDGTYDEIGGIVFDLMGYRETENSNEWSDRFFEYLFF